MPVILKNNAFSTLATAITASDTAIVVADGSQFPALSAGEYFYATLVSPAGTTEIVKVTARVSNSLTVVRAQDGSSAASFQVGALVDMRVNAASISELRDEASEVSIADAGGYYTATDVEGALQELAQDTLSRVNVAALLADTALSYSNVTVGDSIRTRAEGYAYEVAASGATDQHVTTAGGVKLYVEPYPIIDARAFGIIGGVDETSKLEALRQFAIQYPGTTFDFRNIATKELQYMTPKWLAEVQDVTVNLTGISLYNLGANTYGYSDMVVALNLGSGPYWHNNQGTGQINPANAFSGHLINDATAGTTSVTLTTAADASGYAVGNRVLLNWFDRQGQASFPPNPGYFEWLTIASIVGGVITFTTALKNNYKAQAPDYTTNPLLYGVSSGKARILNLTRTGYTEAGTIRLIGGIGLETPGSGSVGYRGALTIGGAARVEVEGASFKAVFSGASETNIIRRSKFSGGITEFDKVVGNVLCEDCEFNGTSQGTGVQSFEMKGGKLYGQAQLRMREITLDGVEIATTPSGNIMVSMDQYPRYSVTVKNCRIVPTGGATSAIQVGNVSSVTPDAITNTLITVNTGNAAYSQMLLNIEIGNVLTLNDGTPPEHFYVTGFSFDASNNLLIAGYCEVATPGAGLRQMWFAHRFKRENNTIINPPARFNQLTIGRRVWHIDSDVPGVVKVSKSMHYGEYATVNVNCYVTSVIVDVVKPYTGTDTLCTVATAVQGAGQPQAFITANGKTAGRRTINVAGQYGSQSGDTLTALPNRAWCEDLIIHLNGDGGTGAFTDGSLPALPLIRVTIEGYKPPLNLQEL
jgi:hypothetical protein